MTQAKGISGKLSIGRDDEDFLAGKPEGTRLSQFWHAVKTNTWLVVKTNLLALLFALPAIAWYIIMDLSKRADSMLVPNTTNIGIGLPVVADAVAVGNYRAFIMDMRIWLVMIPLIMVASVGLAGAFYVARKRLESDTVPVLRTFFTGIKLCWLPFLIMSTLLATSGLLLVFAFGALKVYTDVSLALRILGLIGAILQFAVLAVMTMFVFTQAASYKLGAFGLIKNSFLFTVVLLPRNFIMLLLTAGIVSLLFLLPQMLMMFVVVFFLLIGIMFLILMWTVYGNWAFNKYLDARVLERINERKKSQPSTKQNNEVKANTKERNAAREPLRPLVSDIKTDDGAKPDTAAKKSTNNTIVASASSDAKSGANPADANKTAAQPRPRSSVKVARKKKKGGR